jgi:hypothetical protein
VEETVAKLAQIFRANVGYNPTHGYIKGRIHLALSRQFRGMKNNDLGEKQQNAILVCVYHEIYNQALANPNEPHGVTIAWLQVLAFFFCMRSCEYSDVKGERKTIKICVKNISFFWTNTIIPNNSSEIFVAFLSLHNIRMAKKGYTGRHHNTPMVK